MPKPLSPTTVIRTLPTKLLQDFCTARHIHFPPEFWAGKLKPKKIVNAYSELPDEHRQQFHLNLKDLHEMNSEEATIVLVREATHKNIPLTEDFHDLPSACAGALWFLLHHHKVFSTAQLILASEHLPAKSCTTVIGTKQDSVPNHTVKDFSEFRRALTQYYGNAESRGPQTPQ